MLASLRARPLTILLVIVFAILLVQTSWVGDDAYITMRTIDNFVHGYGLRWNIDERVQTYTHPLWLFLAAGVYRLTGDSAVTLMGLSIVVSTLTLFLLLILIPKNNAGLLFGWSGLIFSKAFVDYSSSGLENPATHFLLLIFAYLYLSGTPLTSLRIFLLSLTAGLAAFNRLDSMLFYLPALFQVFWANRNWKVLGLLIAGFFPLFLWEIFSLIYYGFPLPNTYYAKLTAGIPASELAAQGVLYFINSLTWNPITLALIFASILIAFIHQSNAERWLAAGITLYLVYIVMIGGDFMSGRFLTAPLLVGVILLIRHVQERPVYEKWVWFGVIFALGTLLAPLNPLSSRYTTFISTTGIADEAAGYFPYTNLMLLSRDEPLPTYPWANMGRDMKPRQLKVTAESGIGMGMYGYFIGREVHLIDRLGLCDPLLARLPAHRDGSSTWRIAHFERLVPAGYIETFETGQNQIKDPDLAQYYNQLRLVTSGELWSPARWHAIWMLNTGQSHSLLAAYVARQNAP